MKDLEAIIIVIGIISAFVAVFVQLHSNYKNKNKDE